MPYAWDEYSGNSDTPTLPLLLSERSQQLLLAVVQNMQPRYKWYSVDDTTWDDIDAQLADTITELIEIVEQPTMSAFTAYSTTTSASLAANSYQTIPIDFLNDPDDIASLSSNQITINEAGLYSVNLILSVRNAATASSNKQAILVNKSNGDATLAIGVPTLMGANAIVRAWNAMNEVFECESGDVLEFWLYGVSSATTIESDGTIGGRASRCFQAHFTRVR